MTFLKILLRKIFKKTLADIIWSFLKEIKVMDLD